MLFSARRIGLVLLAVIASAFALAGVIVPSQAQPAPAAAPAPHAVKNRPVGAAGTGPEQVEVGMYLNQLLNVDLETNTFDADFYLWMKWKGDIDPTTSYDFVNQTNSTSMKILPTYEKPTVDAATGVKYQSWHIQATFVQPLTFAEYPKTGYSMHIGIQDNTYDSSALVYVTPTGLQTATPVVSPGGWDVSDPTASVTDVVFNTNFGDPAATAPLTFSEADFSFTIERSDPTRVIKAILPIIIIMAITLLAFLIPAHHLDGRLVLTVTALISAVLLHDAAIAELPAVGYFVAIDKVYLLSYLVVFLTLLECVVVYRWDKEGKDARVRKTDIISLVVLATMFVVGMALALAAGG